MLHDIGFTVSVDGALWSRAGEEDALEMQHSVIDTFKTERSALIMTVLHVKFEHA